MPFAVILNILTLTKMKQLSTYMIDGLNQVFKTLDDVELHIFLMCESDREQMDGTLIMCYNEAGDLTATYEYIFATNSIQKLN